MKLNEIFTKLINGEKFFPENEHGYYIYFDSNSNYPFKILNTINDTISDCDWNNFKNKKYWSVYESFKSIDKNNFIKEEIISYFINKKVQNCRLKNNIITYQTVEHIVKIHEMTTNKLEDLILNILIKKNINFNVEHIEGFCKISLNINEKPKILYHHNDTKTLIEGFYYLLENKII
jgi:hypothetical protein